MNQPPPPKPPTLLVQFFLRHGAVVSWPVGDVTDFSFPALINGIRSAGCFLHHDVYIPGDEIACIGLLGGAAKVRQPSVQQAPHPTRQ